jgi:hydrogenase maturation protein HypF
VRPSPSTRKAHRILLSGTVQGVGFRPYVYRLASALELEGQVANGPEGVTIEVCGPRASVEAFLERLPEEAPQGARIGSLAVEPLEAPEDLGPGFRIQPSRPGARLGLVQADLVPCPSCLEDLHRPGDRRYRYPFTSCAECGPRFSLVDGLPYERARTTLRRFPLCPDCQAEYEDPSQRRFHAESISCPSCGPQLQAWGAAEAKGAALTRALETLAGGGLIALKGLGGWQLACLAKSAEAVARLRRFKGRPRKPLALMAPDLAAVQRELSPSRLEERALTSPAGPIVLLEGRPGDAVCEGVAPGLSLFGVMLPSSALHHLLAGDLGRWLVVTSGNLEGEPTITDDLEARRVLGRGVDLVLGHDLAIARRADDSLVRVAAGHVVLLRRGRGWAGLPLRCEGGPLPLSLALGGHLKSTLALGREGEVWVSSHLGDLEGPSAREAQAELVREVLSAEPSATLACDLHPDYASTRLAEGLARPLTRVQHHEAHALSVWGERAGGEPALAIAWDGSGWGPDGTIWGGEAFLLRRPHVERCARLRPFRLPGGVQAIREPRRAAFGLLHALGGEELLEALAPELTCLSSFSPPERALLARALARDLNAPWTSSVGRLFDAVAALLDLCQRSSYEAEAALALELCARGPGDRAYPLPLVERPAGELRWLDWAPLIRALLADLAAGAGRELVAARFHRSLAAGIVALARWAEQPLVLLSGGCFQNARLLEEVSRGLSQAGFRVAWPRELPPNDGGLGLGQLVAGAWAQERAECV